MAERVLLKLSGEALGGLGEQGLDPERIQRLAGELHRASQSRVQIALVVGGGNFLRGAQAGSIVERTTADTMGMLATVLNGLAIRDALRAVGQPAQTYCAFPIGTLVEPFRREVVLETLHGGGIAILVGGTGHPFFTTDTCASLRAIELGARRLLKATKVDGVYSGDPQHDPTAQRYDRLTYDEVLKRDLRIMDGAAIALCREHKLPILVFDLFAQGALLRALTGESCGTLVSGEDLP